jgi:hypothetical protein
MRVFHIEEFNSFDWRPDMDIANATNRVLLNDEGPAIRSIGERHLANFLCCRRTIEGLGSKTFLPAFGRRLLFALSDMEYWRFSPIVKHQFETTSVLATGVTEQGFGRFCKHFGFDILGDRQWRTRSMADTQGDILPKYIHISHYDP